MPIHDVRLTPEFYADLRTELARSEAPQVSVEQFELYELPVILHLTATNWEKLPERFPGHGRYRILIQAGVLVAAYAVEGELLRDGRVALLSIRIDPGARDDAFPGDPEDPPSDGLGG